MTPWNHYGTIAVRIQPHPRHPPRHPRRRDPVDPPRRRLNPQPLRPDVRHAGEDNPGRSPRSTTTSCAPNAAPVSLPSATRPSSALALAVADADDQSCHDFLLRHSAGVSTARFSNFNSAPQNFSIRFAAREGCGDCGTLEKIRELPGWAQGHSRSGILFLTDPRPACIFPIGNPTPFEPCPPPRQPRSN